MVAGFFTFDFFNVDLIGVDDRLAADLADAFFATVFRTTLVSFFFDALCLANFLAGLFLVDERDVVVFFDLLMGWTQVIDCLKTGGRMSPSAVALERFGGRGRPPSSFVVCRVGVLAHRFAP